MSGIDPSKEDRLKHVVSVLEKGTPRVGNQCCQDGDVGFQELQDLFPKSKFDWPFCVVGPKDIVSLLPNSIEKKFHCVRRSMSTVNLEK